ncbi:DUF1616 domain-containing protein [Halapricum sp. CBA1109]|uniref:DUF1616 domain-containing protein n=1 Tax=Halapricum sp. CBA1109 TaxID=2668068 RepID=UPI0018D1FDB9|nr:DUF1616 domain-containing protein [Halapricum sp. CBA1109]
MDSDSARSQSVPTDLAAIVGFTLLAAAAVSVLEDSLLRVLFGLPFVLFVPGYAFVAALFPEAPVSGADERIPSRPDLLTRLVYACTFSIGLLSLYGLGIERSGIGVTFVGVVLGTVALTLLFVAVAAFRWSRLPPDERFTLQFSPWLHSVRRTLSVSNDRRDTALSVLAVVTLLLALAAVGYVTAVPKQGQSYTELYVLPENDTAGGEYPDTLTAGETERITVGVENNENQAVTYSGVVELQRVAGNGESRTVSSTETLDSFTAELSDGEMWQQRRDITPTTSGDRLRLVVLLYRGNVPSSPSVDTAYRSVRLWVTVEE